MESLCVIEARTCGAGHHYGAHQAAGVTSLHLVCIDGYAGLSQLRLGSQSSPTGLHCPRQLIAQLLAELPTRQCRLCSAASCASGRCRLHQDVDDDGGSQGGAAEGLWTQVIGSYGTAQCALQQLHALLVRRLGVHCLQCGSLMVQQARLHRQCCQGG